MIITKDVLNFFFEATSSDAKRSLVESTAKCRNITMIFSTTSRKDILQLGIRRNTKQLKRLKTEAKKLLDSVLSAENSALDLQLADYIFNELLRMAPEYAEDPYDGSVEENSIFLEKGTSRKHLF
nr:unnamed protein product [Haemonchus contortus]